MQVCFKVIVTLVKLNQVKISVWVKNEGELNIFCEW